MKCLYIKKQKDLIFFKDITEINIANNVLYITRENKAPMTIIYTTNKLALRAFKKIINKLQVVKMS